MLCIASESCPAGLAFPEKAKRDMDANLFPGIAMHHYAIVMSE